jgi:ADP-ribose pyrophosphatase YjhB (NUDIX family)
VAGAAALAALVAGNGRTLPDLPGVSDASRAATATLLEAIDRLFRRRRGQLVTYVRNVIEQEMPDAPASRVEELARQEVQRELEFQRKARARLAADLPRALGNADQRVREAEVRQIMDREKRYLGQRESAAASRVVAALEHDLLKGLSPEGAYWQLSPLVREHTLGCLALGGKVWSWPVLDEVHPQLHAGCQCRLLGVQEAIDAGLMTRDELPDPSDAAARAQSIAAEVRRLEESMAPEELSAVIADLERVRIMEARERRAMRWAAGTVKGGEFRPTRGGDPGKTAVTKLAHQLSLGDIAGRRDAGAGRSVHLRGQERFIPEQQHWDERIGGVRYTSPAGGTNVYRDGVLIGKDHPDLMEPGGLHPPAPPSKVEQPNATAANTPDPPLDGSDRPTIAAQTPVEGIPDYTGTELTLGKRAGGSQGAMFAFDKAGTRWLVKDYRGNQDRIATELLSNAIYREMGAPAANAGTYELHGEPDFSKVPDVKIADEPPLPKLGKGRRMSTGVIVREPDGSMWVYEPKGHYCVPLDTDVLTEEGWKAHDEVRAGDRTLGFNPATGQNEWTSITAVHHYDNAPMVRYGTQKWSVRCTPNHRWLLEGMPRVTRAEQARRVSHKREAIRELLAEGVSQTRIAERVGCSQGLVSLVARSKVGRLRGRDEERLPNGYAMAQAHEGVAKTRRLRLAAPHGEGDERVMPSDAALIAWLVTDGCIRHSRGPGTALSASITQGKARGVEALEELLEGVPHTRHARGDGCTTYRLRAEALRGLLARTAWDAHKESVPKLVLNLAPDALRAFMHAAWLAEGEAGRSRLWQNDGPVQEALVIGAYRLGQRPVVTGARRCKAVGLNAPTITGRRVAAVADGSAPAWCVTTELGTWTMRQGGVVALTGNSGYEHTFPKGGLENGLSPQQNALKELWEETGLHAAIDGFVGDFKGDTGTSRYYVASRTGGTPHPPDATPYTPGGSETAAVKRLTPEEARQALNKPRDQTILDAVLSMPVPEAGKADTFPEPVKGPALAYPTVPGDVREWKGGKQEWGPSRRLGEHYMTDALVANWDVAGLTKDNVLWQADPENPTGEDRPVRLDQGGTLQFRAQGQPKPFGPVPTEVWSLRSPKGQAFDTMQVSEADMRDQARAIGDTLTDGKIDQLVDQAPFADSAMRQEVRDALKARVQWMRDFADGEQQLPQPLEGAAARRALAADQRDLQVFPEEHAALDDFARGGWKDVNAHMRSGADKSKTTPEVREMVKQLDGLTRAAKLADDVHAYVAYDPAKLGDPQQLVGRTLSDKGFATAVLGRGALSGAPGVIRLTLPAGSHAVYAQGVEGLDDLPRSVEMVLARGGRWRVQMVSYENGRPIVTAVLLP